MITLTTDFGTRDPYVAEMKAVALRINPHAAFVDISHHIAPQNVLEGAFVLGSAYRFFPQDTIHVAVVDPGVGTSRRAILLTSPDGRFLAPDNGLLTYAIRESAEYQTAVSGKGFGEPVDASIPEGYAAYELSNESLRLSPLSDTFHGRDVFAPAAAHLSLGIPPEEVGERLESLVCLCIPRPEERGGSIAGHVVHVDGYGNLITTIDGEPLLKRNVEALVKGRRIRGISRSYQEGPDTLAIVGSHGSLELAVRNGNAARELGVEVGDEVIVELRR